MAELQENETIQSLLTVLVANQEHRGQDLSALLSYVDGMSHQLDAVTKELQEVKSQLAEIKDDQSTVKDSLALTVPVIENSLERTQEQIRTIKDSIIQGATQLLANFKQSGISALDKAVSILGVKEALNVIRADLSKSIIDINKSIKNVETIGQELRSANHHLKNVGRVATGKEQQEIDGSKAGQVSATILAPLHACQKLLTSMENATLSAIDRVEHLEQAAGNGRDQTAERPSIRKEIETIKAQATTLTQEKQTQGKSQELAL